MIKTQPEMTEQMKSNHFHSLLRKNALQTFRNINSSNRQTLEDVLVILRRKYVQTASQATAKHKWHRLTFDPDTIKMPDFLEELNQGAEKAFGENAKNMIDSLLYAKLPSKLKRSVNMARLENGSYEEIVKHLERELELNALEESDDLPNATMASAQTESEGSLLSSGIDPKTICTYCKEEGHNYRNCPKLKAKKEREAKGEKKTKMVYPKCPTCEKKQPPLKKDVGSGRTPQAQKKKTEDRETIEECNKKEESSDKNHTTSKTPNSILKNTNAKKLTLPRLQIYPMTRITNFVICDPPLATYKEYQEHTVVIPTVVWQQQMEIAGIETQNIINDTNGILPIKWEHDHTNDFITRFRQLSLIEDYDPYYIDPEYNRDPYRDDGLYDQQLLQIHHNLLRHTHTQERD